MWANITRMEVNMKVVGKIRIGKAPNLLWWHLKNMTEKEIEEFNRKYMVEIEMNDKPKAIIDYCPRCDNNYLTDLPHECEMTSKPYVPAMSDDASKVVWNAAIEAAANSIHNKFDNHGWNYHLPSVGREVEALIRKLKK